MLPLRNCGREPLRCLASANVGRLSGLLMNLLYCDESNLEEKSGDFLLYAGVVINGASAAALSSAIDMIRKQRRVPVDYRLKFNPGPEGLKHAEFIELKSAIIKSAVEHGAQLIAYAVLHDLARDPDLARRNGINTVCYHFHCILQRLDAHGLVLIDRFSDGNNEIEAHLRDKFSIGLTGLPYSSELRLDTIVGFHYSAVGQSHFASLIDIVVGSLRFAINAHTRGKSEHTETAKAILRSLAPMFFRTPGQSMVPELGFQFSPKVVKSDRYRAQYASLKDFLGQAGVEIEQPITNERQY